MSKIKDHIEFIYQFFNKPSLVGAIMPSSKFLARNIVNFINFKRKNLVIIEYGPGTGPFTSEIVKKLKDGDKLLLIEQNKKFIENLVQKYNRYQQLTIIEGSVSNVKTILEENKIKQVDYIVSGIPFSSIPKEVTLDIMENTQSIMNNQSLFITFQYSTLKLKLFKRYFEIVSKKFILRNVPSAYIICMKKFNLKK
tara:strand:- start:870 stop:1457 length:588 start_codon:yes stop_codon:yes gene_type:complete